MGACHVVTAGHCLVHGGQERDPLQWSFVPALTAGGETPFGISNSVAVKYSEGDLIDGQPAPEVRCTVLRWLGSINRMSLSNVSCHSTRHLNATNTV